MGHIKLTAGHALLCVAPMNVIQGNARGTFQQERRLGSLCYVCKRRLEIQPLKLRVRLVVDKRFFIVEFLL